MQIWCIAWLLPAPEQSISLYKELQKLPQKYREVIHLFYYENMSLEEIPQDRISQYTLYGYFVTSSIKTEGNWRVTFPLEKRN